MRGRWGQRAGRISGVGGIDGAGGIYETGGIDGIYWI